MFGFKFVKFPPTTYVMQYRNGKLRKKGAGLSFLLYSPTSTLVAVPAGSAAAPFMFSEKTGDFQEVTVQGEVTYRIARPETMSTQLDFTLEEDAETYVSEDPEKLIARLVNSAQVLAQQEIKIRNLREALKSQQELARLIQEKLNSAPSIVSLGVEILNVSILAIKASPETARALEAETRESILRGADQAVYGRRNSALLEERKIKENELATEVAVEQKRRLVRETQVEARRVIQQKEGEIEMEGMLARTKLEESNKMLVAAQSENVKAGADAKAHGVKTLMEALAGVDAKVLQALTSANMSPEQIIALAFQSMGENAAKIGELNMTPELLSSLKKSK